MKELEKEMTLLRSGIKECGREVSRCLAPIALTVQLSTTLSPVWTVVVMVP